MSRTQNSLRNIKFSIVGQLLILGVGFVNRMIFLKYLSVEYLGLNGLFTNVISILSLAELGVGSAIVYSLYVPLSKKDEIKISALVNLFRKFYITIGIWMLIAGISLTPFLSFLMRDLPDIPGIVTIYIMFIINASISYFFSYKKLLIIADQKKYLDSLYHSIVILILNISQIVILIFTQSYLIYLTLKIIATFTENYLLSRKANALYPYLKKYQDEKLSVEEKKDVINNVKAMFLHRVGGTIATGTDSIIMSKFVGLYLVGLYSNYLLIISALSMMINIMFDSITASIGNLGASGDKARNFQVFQLVDFIGFWIFAFSSIALYNLLNPFIAFWIGEEFVFSNNIVIIIVLNFFVFGLRKSVLTYRDALGLFWYDRYKPIVEAILNIIISITLAIKLGVVGVLLGTLISTLLTSFWIEPLILFRYGFNTSLIIYYKRYFINIAILLFSGTITTYSCNFVSFDGFGGLIFKIILCTLIPNICFIIFFNKMKEYKSLINILRNIFKIDKNNFSSL